MILEKELKELQFVISKPDQINTEVSQKGTHWQVDHILKSVITICRSLKNSDPETFRSKFNLSRTVIFTLGYIPRGKAKAPKSVISQGAISTEDLQRQLNLAEDLLSQLDRLPHNSHFTHPYFGELNVPMSNRMLVIHTRHHLKIIRDIIRK